MQRGVLVRDDGGVSWRPSAQGMDPNEQIADIVVDPVRPNVLYAGSSRSGLFVSEDSGASWRLHNEGLTLRSLTVLELTADGHTLYAGTNGGGVYRLSTLSQAEFDALGPQPTVVPTAATEPATPAQESIATATGLPASDRDAGDGGLCGAALAMPLLAVVLARRRPG